MFAGLEPKRAKQCSKNCTEEHFSPRREVSITVGEAGFLLFKDGRKRAQQDQAIKERKKEEKGRNGESKADERKAERSGGEDGVL